MIPWNSYCKFPHPKKENVWNPGKETENSQGFFWGPRRPQSSHLASALRGGASYCLRCGPGGHRSPVGEVQIGALGRLNKEEFLEPLKALKLSENMLNSELNYGWTNLSTITCHHVWCMNHTISQDLCSLQDPEAVQVAKQLEREEGFARVATKVDLAILYPTAYRWQWVSVLFSVYCTVLIYLYRSWHLILIVLQDRIEMHCTFLEEHEHQSLLPLCFVSRI